LDGDFCIFEAISWKQPVVIEIIMAFPQMVGAVDGVYPVGTTLMEVSLLIGVII
jgi:hypothetical protein